MLHATGLADLGFATKAQCGDRPFTLIGGIAKPCNLVMLGKFQGLQRAVNAHVEITGFGTKIPVDGDIGSVTLAAVRAILGFTGGTADAGAQVDDLTQRISGLSPAISVDQSADPAGSAPDSGESKDPGSDDAVNKAIAKAAASSSIFGDNLGAIALAGVAGLGTFMLLDDGKKRKRKRKGKKCKGVTKKGKIKKGWVRTLGKRCPVRRSKASRAR